MRFLFPLLLLPAMLGAFQQPKAKPVPKTGAKAESVMLVCHLIGASPSIDSINMYESLGLANKVIARGGRRQPDSAFVFVVPASKSRFYTIGANETSVAKVILGEEKEVTLYANAQYVHKARTVGSKANKAMETVQKRIDQFRAESEQNRNDYNMAVGDDKKPFELKIAKLALAKTKYLDSLKVADPLLWRVASLNIVPNYMGQKGYVNDVDFYSKEYFSNANLADPAFNEIPDVYTAFDGYYHTLVQIGVSEEQFKIYVDDILAKIPSGSKAHRMAMGGLINGAKAASSSLYPFWASKYIEVYKKNDYGEIGRLESDLKKAGTFTPGFEAPELAGMTPDSQSYALSRLRGKVVLVDFWASWCGPCRKENPNVKANYAKYKDKGFDVLGVSLDREAASWKNAIKQDELEWHHISDLKGWQSIYAQIYSVTSIPQTVLVGKDGKIIARNIRGEQLGDKLKQIFGE